MAENIVGEVYLRVNPLDPGFAAGVQKIINKAEQGAALKINTTAAQKSVNDLGNSIQNNLTKGFGSAALEAAGFTAALYTIKRTVEGVIDRFGKLFDVIAKARAGFTSIIGAYNGEKLLQQIRQFAIASPFVTSQLVQYSQQLLGVGRAANTIVPTLQSVGDIVASVGGDTNNLGSILYALTQIQSIGKLTGQDARQLQNQLVPITRYIAEYTGKSIADVKKLQEAGGISSDIVFQAITNQGKKVEGALNASVKTISGAKNVINDTISNLFQSNPGFQKIFDDIVAGIQGINAALGDPKVLGPIEAALTAVTDLYQSLKPVIAGFAEFIAGTGFQALGIFTKIADAVHFVIEALDSVPGLLKVVGAGFAVLATIGVPALLLKYVSSLKGVAFGLLGIQPAALGAEKAISTQAAVVEGTVIANQQYTRVTQEVIYIDERLLFVKELLAKSTEQQTFLELEYIKLMGQRTLAIDAQIVAERELALAREQSSASAVTGAKGPGKLLQSTQGKIQGGLAIGAAVGGQLLQSKTAPTNSAGQGAGKALEYGGYGFILSGGNPAVAAAAAAVGATIGYIDAAEARMKAHIEAARKLGEAAAKAYLQTNEQLFSTATLESTTKLTTDLQTIKDKAAQIDQDTKYFKGLKESQSNSLADTFGIGFHAPSAGEELDAFFERQKKDAAYNNELLTVTQEKYDKLVAPIHETVIALGKAGHAQEFFLNGRGGQSLKTLEGLSDAFASYGITLEDVANKGTPAIVEMITLIDGLDTAQKKATVTANVYAAALKDAAGLSSSIFGAQQTNADKAISQLNSTDQAKKSATAVNAPGQTLDQQALAKATAASDSIKAQTAAFDKAYADSTVDSINKIIAANQKGDAVTSKYLTDNQEKLASDAASAAALKVVVDITDAATRALLANNIAREKANDLARIAKLGVDVEAATRTFDTGNAAIKARGEALSHLSNQSLQFAAQSALLTAQDVAGAEAAAKASEKDRKELEYYLAHSGAVDDQHAKNIQSRIDEAEIVARAAARQKVFNDTLAGGTKILEYNTTAQEIANKATERAIELSEAQNAASAYSADQAAKQSRISAILNPNDIGIKNADRVATDQAVQAAGNAAAQKATENLVKLKQAYVHAYGEDSFQVRALDNQIALTDEFARSAAELEELGRIAKETAFAMKGYDKATADYLLRLKEGQDYASTLLGGKTAVAQNEASRISSIASAGSDIAGIIASNVKDIKGVDRPGVLFKEAGDAAAKAALQVAAYSAQQSQLSALIANGASKALAATDAQKLYDDIITTSGIDIEPVIDKVTKLNDKLNSVDGRNAIIKVTTEGITAAVAALAELQIARANALGKVGTANSGAIPGARQDIRDEFKAQEDALQKIINDIKSGKLSDDILNGISVAAQDLIPAAKADKAGKKDTTAEDAAKAAANALEGLTSKILDATQAIVDAADKWTASIKERTQYETAVSTSRLTKNATIQTKDLTDVQAGLKDLRARGLSEAAIKALGLDNVADVKQIRKLQKSSSGDLTALSAAVGTRDNKALDLATAAEDKRTQDNIRLAIIDAATTLGIDKKTATAQASTIAASFQINSNSNAEEVAAAILAALTSGAISR